MALIYAAICLVVFLVLLGLELFIPSGGLLGVASVAALVAAVILGFMHSLQAGAAILVAVTFGVPVLISFGLRLWPRTAIGKRMLTIDPDGVPSVDLQKAEHDALVGKLGVAKTNLLPSGLIEIEGRRFDALSIGVAINAGQSVEVVSVISGKIQVQPCSDKRTPKPESSISSSLETPIESLGIDES